MVGLFGEFCDLNISVKEIFHQLSEENMIKDQANWFEPKADGFKDFAEKAEAMHCICKRSFTSIV